MSKKIMIQKSIFEDLSRATEILFEIVCTKELNEDDAERLNYVNKLLESCNELFDNLKPDRNDQ